MDQQFNRSTANRRERRTDIHADVSLRRVGHHPFRVRVYDASPSGCRIEFIEQPSLAERVWIKFEGLEPIEASVCWVRGMAGGVEFRRPIHPAVFERLLGTLK